MLKLVVQDSGPVAHVPDLIVEVRNGFHISITARADSLAFCGGPSQAKKAGSQVGSVRPLPPNQSAPPPGGAGRSRRIRY